MNENITQISTYLEMVPSWAIALFTFAIVVGIFIEIINRKRRFYAIDNFRNTIETEFAALYPNHKVWPKNIQEFFAARMPEMHHDFEVLRLFIPQKRWNTTPIGTIFVIFAAILPTNNVKLTHIDIKKLIMIKRCALKILK